MYYTMYASKENMVPKQFENVYRSLYFIFYVIFLNFFITNLFVGVVVSSYNNQKEK